MTKSRPSSRIERAIRASSSSGVPPRLQALFVLSADPCMRRLLACPLEAEGYQVFAARDERELFLQLSATGGPGDLVVCDVREDTTLLGRLSRVDWEALRVRVMLLARTGDPEAGRLAHRLGAVAVFGPGTQAFDLRPMVERVLEEGSTVDLGEV